MSSTSWLTSFPGFNYVTSLAGDFLASLLRAGPVPKHIAFVMDGNRRYAKKLNQETREGHNAGFDSLAHILSLCYSIGVQTVTVYAFSIENFKRPKYEVDNLMEITKEKLEQICEKEGIVEKYGIKLNIIGKKSLLRKDVREMVDKVMKMTENNSKVVLNVCFPYTSRDDIATAASKSASLVTKGVISSSEITSDFLESQMYLAESPPLDIFIRTSGVERLSDFLVWQIHGRKKSFSSLLSTLHPTPSPAQNDDKNDTKESKLFNQINNRKKIDTNGKDEKRLNDKSFSPSSSSCHETTSSNSQSSSLNIQPNFIGNHEQSTMLSSKSESQTAESRRDLSNTDEFSKFNAETFLEFTTVLWPEFTTWDLFWIIIKWGYVNRGKLDDSYYLKPQSSREKSE